MGLRAVRTPPVTTTTTITEMADVEDATMLDSNVAKSCEGGTNGSCGGPHPTEERGGNKQRTLVFVLSAVAWQELQEKKGTQ